MKPAPAAVLLLAVTVTLAASAGGPSYWAAFLHGDREPGNAHRVELVGGDGASLPSATPESAGLDPAALEAAGQTARSLGAQALLIARHGHQVYEHYDRGPRRVRSTLLARLVQGAGNATLDRQGRASFPTDASAPATGSLHNPWSSRSQWRFGAVMRSGDDVGTTDWVEHASRELWRPLMASTAWYELDGNGRPRADCCLWLYPRDALALAVAVASGGQVDGQRVLDPKAASTLLSSLADGVAPRGAEAFGARQARLFRDTEGSRLYFFPAQDVAILLVRADDARLTDETALALQVLRGVIDAPASGPPTPRGLVPGHD